MSSDMMSVVTEMLDEKVGSWLIFFSDSPYMLSIPLGCPASFPLDGLTNLMPLTSTAMGIPFRGSFENQKIIPPYFNYKGFISLDII